MHVRWGHCLCRKVRINSYAMSRLEVKIVKTQQLFSCPPRNARDVSVHQQTLRESCHPETLHAWDMSFRDTTLAWDVSSRDTTRAWDMSSRDTTRVWDMSSRDTTRAWDMSSRYTTRAWDMSSRDTTRAWDMFKAELAPERFWRGPISQKVWGGWVGCVWGGEGGGRWLYLTLHCHLGGGGGGQRYEPFSFLINYEGQRCCWSVALRPQKP